MVVLGSSLVQICWVILVHITWPEGQHVVLHHDYLCWYTTGMLFVVYTNMQQLWITVNDCIPTLVITFCYTCTCTPPHQKLRIGKIASFNLAKCNAKKWMTKDRTTLPKSVQIKAPVKYSHKCHICECIWYTRRWGQQTKPHHDYLYWYITGMLHLWFIHNPHTNHKHAVLSTN